MCIHKIIVFQSSLKRLNGFVKICYLNFRSKFICLYRPTSHVWFNMDLSYTYVLMVYTWVDCLLFQIQVQSIVCIVCNILKCIRYMIFTASIKHLRIFLRTACLMCRGQFHCHVQTSILCWIHGVGLVLVLSWLGLVLCCMREWRHAADNGIKHIW